jgi:hypothetical protein
MGTDLSQLEGKKQMLLHTRYCDPDPDTQLSYASPDRLKRTADLLLRMRRIIELFNRCVDACDEDNETRIAMVDFLDPLTIILTDSITYLRDCTSGWPL